MKSKIGIVLGALLIVILVAVGVIVYKNNQELEILEKFVSTNTSYNMGSNYKMIMTRNGVVFTTYYKDAKAKLTSTNTQTYTWSTSGRTIVVVEGEKKYLEVPNNTTQQETISLVPQLGSKGKLGDLISVYKDGEDKYCLEFSEGKIWIDSSSYMTIAYKDYNADVTLKYEFNTVTDEDVEEPNLEGYEKMEQ